MWCNDWLTKIKMFSRMNLLNESKYIPPRMDENTYLNLSSLIAAFN